MHYLILLVFFCQLNMANASEGVQTRSGKIEIKEVNKDEAITRIVTLNNKTIYKAEEFVYLSIAKNFKINENDVLLITESMGGSGSIPSLFFITLIKGKAPIISESFLDPQGEPIQKGNQIIIDLGFLDGQQSTLIYENGKTTVKKETPKKDDGKLENDCNSLYNDYYKKFIEDKSCSAEIGEVGGMATFRPYNILISNPFIDSVKFEKLTKTSCQKANAVKYSEFKSEVCNK